MNLPRLSLLAAALTFIGSALMPLASPQRLAAMVEFGASPVGLMEIRAAYGGLFLGTGTFFLLCAGRESWFRPGLAAQICLMGGFVAARALSLAVDGMPSLMLAMLFACEATVLGLGVVALRRLGPAAE
ncbi:MAG: DUF4345 domain-containing protein [Deltaproteobacteria bacterium]|nr:DUF4345 domain-containing protein [Deltaproteobacteria bacterium]